VRQERCVGGAAHHIAAGGQGAERVAVIALAAGNEAGALGLANFDEVLAGGGFFGVLFFRGGGGGIRVVWGGRVGGDEGFGEFLGSLVGEQSRVDVGHLGELFGDSSVDLRVAVAEAGDGGSAGAVDDSSAVGGVQIDPFASRREHRVGEQSAVEDTAH